MFISKRPMWGLATCFLAISLAACEPATKMMMGEHDHCDSVTSLISGNPVLSAVSQNTVTHKHPNNCEDIVLSGDVAFEVGSAVIRPSFMPVLDEIATFMRVKNRSFDIIGHTDDTGDVAYNQALSERRAQAVVHYLVMRGVSKDFLRAHGEGELNPIASNATEEGRQQNRRVELRAVK